MYVFRQKQQLSEPLKAQAKSKDDFLMAEDVWQPRGAEQHYVFQLTLI